MAALLLVTTSACSGSGGGGGDDVSIETLPLGCERTVERLEQRLEGISLESASLADVQAYQRHLSAASDSLATNDCAGEFLSAADEVACTALSRAGAEPGAGAVLDVARESACDVSAAAGGLDGDCDDVVAEYAEIMDREFDRIADDTGIDDPVDLLGSDAFEVSPEAELDLDATELVGEAACDGGWDDLLDDARRDADDAHRPWPARP